MNKMLVADTFAEVYKEVVCKVLKDGKQIKARNLEAHELLQQTVCIKKPNMNLVYIEGRKFSLLHAIVESMLLVVKENRVASYTVFNKRMAEFSDDGNTLYGAYGYRIADSIWYCIDKLKKDKYTRQAVLTIHKANDVKNESKDIPCTISLQFTIRNEKLNMHVYMRSNDVVLGMPYDVFVFTNLQMLVANELGIKLGKYYHTVTSLHAYDSDVEMLKKIAASECKPVGHKNKNTLSDYQSMALVLFKYANYQNLTWQYVEEMRYYDNDKTYSLPVLMGLNGNFTNEDKEDANEFFECGVKKLKSKKKYAWLRNFTKRWWNDDYRPAQT